MLKGLWLLLLPWIIPGAIAISYAQENNQKNLLMPVIDGDWWEIAGSPDLGQYTSEKQEPVDFGVWQAADGTWQLWSCIRGTKSGGRTRLFYRWEGKNITDKDWTPKGIAMEADTSLGEEKAGLQAPFVLKERNIYYMFYGDWNRICLASSSDGKNFSRVLNNNGNPALFSGPMYNTRDAMVLKTKGIFYCYYTAHLKENDKTDQPKSAVFCRTSKDIHNWSEPVVVSRGGSAAKQTNWFGGDSECPFVIKIKDRYILFRNQLYGKNSLNTQYSSTNPLDFGVDNDDFKIGQLPVAAPEVIKVKGQYYIVALKPALDGIRVAKLKFEK
jgi:hypothetical protein